MRLMLVLLGLFHLGNGLFMVVAPGQWYAAVPGVVETGPMNHHFIVDIGLAFTASGTGMIAGSRGGAVASAIALAGATWPALHALFHLWEWIANGIPQNPRIMASDAIAVMLVSFLGFALAWARARDQGAV